MEGVVLYGANAEEADFREATLEDVVFWDVRMRGADFREARMNGATFFEARMEGANFSKAQLARAAGRYDLQMQRALFRQARLDWANFAGARMEWADFSAARMAGANLTDAQLEGANLREARIVGASLVGANLRSAKWVGSQIQASVASGADLRGGEGLTQSLLSLLIGDDRTLLPDAPDPDTGQPVFLWSCWATEPEGWSTLVANLGRLELTESKTREAFLCAPGEVRRRTGTPWPLDEPPPWETNPQWQPEDRAAVEAEQLEDYECEHC
jgi:uncharacterized protein YjbI with pentapeptide repeats